MSNFAKRIADEYAKGNINSYMAERLAKVSELGMTSDLADQAVDDAVCASNNDIDSDDKYASRFFILNIADDMLEKRLLPEEKEELCVYVAKNKGDIYKLDNLGDYRTLMHEWFCKKGRNKVAYPNTYGKQNREVVYDRYKWTETANAVYNTIKTEGLGRDTAIKVATPGWDADERFKFTNWLRYYESGNTEKYNVKTANKKQAHLSIDDLGLPEHMLNPETRSNNAESRPQASYKKQETERDKELQKADALKRKMKARIRSMRRLLDRYNEILPQQDLDLIHDEMYSLDKSVMKLDIYASMEDCVIRSANRIKRAGFNSGADLLYKFAADPVAAPEPTEVPENVVEALPPPVSGEPDIPNVDLTMIISRLEGLTKSLKARDLIRDLSSADILLNELGLASYFPELGDSQSKLIEAFSYASNRVESIVSKLRGSGKSAPKRSPKKQQPLPQPPQSQPKPKLDTNELKGQPVGEVKRELPAKQ